MIGYVTVAEADEFVRLNFPSNSEVRTNWESLTNEDKEALLRVSFRAIESLPYRGKKTVPGQPNAFPRNGATEVPDRVKSAQIINGAYATDNDFGFYRKLRDLGVESYSIGNLSESLGGVPNSQVASLGLNTQEALWYLTPYLSGGYCIV